MPPSSKRTVVLPAIAIAFGGLATLGVLIGWVGASRAYAVGLHTLFRDHPMAVAITVLATATAAVVLGRRIAVTSGVWLALLCFIAADLFAVALVTVAIDELRRYPDLMRALLTESAGGLQIAAAGLGVWVGFLTRRKRMPFAAAR